MSCNNRFFPAVVALGLAGCATTERVAISVRHPAEIDMSAYRQIAIGEITGNLGQDFSDHLKETLIGSGQFQVVDRRRLQQIFRELKLSQSDLSDPRYRKRIGRLLSGAALVAGHAEGKVESKVTHQDITRTETIKDENGNKVKKEVPVRIFVRTCAATGTGGIDIVSVETGEILKTKILRAGCSERAQDEKAAPDCRSEDELLACAQRENVAAMARALMPWSEVRMVPFAKDRLIPELEEGIRRASIGEMAEAAKIFQGAAAAAEVNPKIKPAVIAKAYWNLGLTYEYSDLYDDAIAALKKAYMIGADPKSLREQESVRGRQAEQAELRKQSGPR